MSTASRTFWKGIITCAVTGAVTPSMSSLPVTPEEIIADSLAAAAGIAILHLHARNSLDGRPDQSPESFTLPFTHKQNTEAVINTLSADPYMSVAERAAPAATYKPELASLNMGSMNLVFFQC